LEERNMNTGEQKQAKGGGVLRTIGGVAALMAGIAVVALAIRWSDRTIDEQPQQPAAPTSAVVVQEREPVSDIGDCDVALTLTAADGGRNLDLSFSARNGKWLAAGVDGRGRMNVEQRTSNADRPTGTTVGTTKPSEARRSAEGDPQGRAERSERVQHTNTEDAARRNLAANTKGGTAAATAQAGTPVVPAGGQAGGNDGEGKTVLVRPETRVGVEWLAARLGLLTRAGIASGISAASKRLEAERALQKRWRKIESIEA
jgi:hypothetical protein